MFKRARCLVTAVLGPCRCSSNRRATLLAIFYLLERLTRPTAGWLFMSYTGISSALFLSLPLLSGKRLPASDVTTQGLSATVSPHSYEKKISNSPHHSPNRIYIPSFWTWRYMCYDGINHFGVLTSVKWLKAFASTTVCGWNFVDAAYATPCAGPLIVLAASPGLGAETMALDVKPKRAADDVHAVTTTTVVHVRPLITLSPTQSKKCDREKER